MRANLKRRTGLREGRYTPRWLPACGGPADGFQAMRPTTPPPSDTTVPQRPVTHGHALRRLALHSTLASTQKLVLVAIAEHLGSKLVARPSYVELARLTGLTRRHVITTVGKLFDQGILTIGYRPGSRSNCYWASLEALAQLVPDVTCKPWSYRLPRNEPATSEPASPDGLTRAASESPVTRIDA